MESYLRDDLIFTNLKYENKEEVLKFLASELVDKELVENGYSDSIITREIEFPTGLPSTINVAIPHTDSGLVKETSIAVGVLSEPVQFESMDNPEKILNVELVLMLAMKEAHGQLEMLQKIIKLIQNENILRDIVNEKKPVKIKKILKRHL